MRLWVGVMVWCLASTVQADTLTRREVQIMHDAGIRMALMRADGTSEKPYVIPVEIRPEVLLQTELLDFSGQPLSQVPGWLVKFKNLRKLDLSNTGLRVDGNLLAALGNMPELSVLNLSGNPLFPENDCWFCYDPVVTLNGVWQKLTQLTELRLTNTGATAENLGSFAPLENLTHLYLGGNRIGDGIAKLGLANPSNLKKLSLQNNGISQDPLPDLPTQSLVELSLAENDLRELAFVDMPNLEQWDVSRNPNLKLATGFGDMFALGALQVLGYDKGEHLPAPLLKRMQAKMEQAKAAIAKAEQLEQERKKAALHAEQERQAAARRQAEEKERAAIAKAEQERKKAAEAKKVATRQPFEPEMVSIPAGTFTMGCDPKRDEVEGGCYDNEKPAHPVTLSAFNMGKYEVTFDEWDACEQANVCPHAKDHGWGRGNRPVVNVRWNDITQKYLPWLSRETGKRYRLPTEAEWEYAARGGQGGAYPWGQEASHEYANYGKDTCCGGLASGKDQWEYTAPVGSFAVNGYGLHDMHGNVWEWVEDCWQDDYKDAPVDGSARQGCGADASRVLRGGSWFTNPQWLRSADRFFHTPPYRDDSVGFRAARTN